MHEVSDLGEIQSQFKSSGFSATEVSVEYPDIGSLRIGEMNFAATSFRIACSEIKVGNSLFFAAMASDDTSRFHVSLVIQFGSSLRHYC